MTEYEIRQTAVLGTSTFQEIGNIVGAYWSADGKLLAVVGSEYGIGTWPPFRVGVYDTASLELQGMLDDIRYEVCDVAFHPSGEAVAVAVGNSDGGYLYEGNLHIWDLKTNRSHRLLREQIQVTRCRFSEDGKTLYFVHHPPTDDSDPEDYKAYECRGFEKYGQIFVDDLKQVAVEGDPHPKQGEQREVLQKLRDFAAEKGIDFEARSSVEDLAFVGEDELVSVGFQHLVERWRTDGTRLHVIPAKTREMGAEIVSPYRDGACLINVRDRDGWYAETRLMRYDVQTGELEDVPPLQSFPRAVTLSRTSTGHVLIRHQDSSFDKKAPVDHLLRADGQLLEMKGLGRQERGFSLRVDGAEHFYVCDESYPPPYKYRRLRQVDPQTGTSTPLFELEWETELDESEGLYTDDGCFVRDEIGEGLVVSLRRYHDSDWHEHGSWIMRRALPDGAIRWKRQMSSQVLAVVWLEELGVIAASLADGTLAVVSASDGGMLAQASVPAPLTSLAGRGQQIAGGTRQGQIVCLELVKKEKGR